MSLTARILTFIGFVAILVGIVVGTGFLFIEIGNFIPVLVQALTPRG